MGEEGADHVLAIPRTGPQESSESEPVPWRGPPPCGRLERENALENEFRNQDFFFSDGEGDGEHDPLGCEGDKDETELMLVVCEVTLDTESLDNWRDINVWLDCGSIFPNVPASIPCFRNWSTNWRKSCSSFSCRSITYFCLIIATTSADLDEKCTLCSAVIVNDCRRLVMLAKDCSNAATTWAWKNKQNQIDSKIKACIMGQRTTYISWQLSRQCMDFLMSFSQISSQFADLWSLFLFLRGIQGTGCRNQTERGTMTCIKKNKLRQTLLVWDTHNKKNLQSSSLEFILESDRRAL